MRLTARRITLLLVLVLAACADSGGTPPLAPQTEEALAAEVPAADEASFWPRFHGPTGSNISTDTGLLRSWPEEGPALVWTADGIGAGFASVTVADGQIYTAGNAGDEMVVTALDLDGGRRWQAANGPAWEESYDGSRGTPTADGERVYHQSPQGQLSCFAATSGEQLWSVNVLQRFGADNIRWGLSESLLVDGDHVITCPGGPRASVAALDKLTGDTVWTAASAGTDAGYASPIIAEHQGRRLVITMTANAVIAVDRADGTLLWRHEHVTDYDVNATMPLYADPRLFISSGYGSGSVMLELTGDGVRKVWENTELDNHHGGVILYDGHLYGAAHKNGGGRWLCLDWQTGTVKYAEKGVGKGSATLAEGLLYTVSEKGQVGLVAATPAGHTLISSFKLAEGGKGPTWAHPVVCGGRLYLRRGDRLFAYHVGASASGSPLSGLPQPADGQYS